MTLERDRLAASLSRRSPTWDVARDILGLDLELPRGLRSVLKGLASERRYYSWMSDDFDRVVSVDLGSFYALFPMYRADWFDPSDPGALRFIVRVSMFSLGLGVDTPGDVLARGRLSGSVRKRVRLLKRLAERADRLEDAWRLRHAQMQAKSRLAYTIDPGRCDDLTLAFCAYLAARANRRSLFMMGPQSRAKDKIVEGLLTLLRENPRTDWLSVAMVRPTIDVIERLDAAERGQLISLYHGQMAIAARELGKLWPSLPERMRREMVAVRGVDSSRWNAYAGALNTMRSAWISAVTAAGLEEILRHYLPGKTPRVMASDVAWMYRNAGGDLHEDTRMFNVLKHPWDVVNGYEHQGLLDVLAAAKETSVDAEKTGWVGPRVPEAAERPEPEPALVHGVVVTDPELGRTLKRCGVFSGKRLRHLDELLDVEIRRSVVMRDDGSLIPTAGPADVFATRP